jgi:hypothetical protein
MKCFEPFVKVLVIFTSDLSTATTFTADLTTATSTIIFTATTDHTSYYFFRLPGGPRNKTPKNRNAFDEEDEDDENIVFPRSSSTR